MVPFLMPPKMIVSLAPWVGSSLPPPVCALVAPMDKPQIPLVTGTLPTALSAPKVRLQLTHLPVFATTVLPTRTPTTPEFVLSVLTMRFQSLDPAPALCVLLANTRLTISVSSATLDNHPTWAPPHALSVTTPLTVTPRHHLSARCVLLARFQMGQIPAASFAHLARTNLADIVSCVLPAPDPPLKVPRNAPLATHASFPMAVAFARSALSVKFPTPLLQDVLPAWPALTS